MNKYVFDHAVLTRGKDGYISRTYTNTYSILARSSRTAHRQVPEGSILKRIMSSDGARIVHDFSKRVPSDVGFDSVRSKLKVFGREGLSSAEYDAAISHGLIPQGRS